MIKAFESINQGYNTVFQAGKLSLGIVIPIENYWQGPVPSMKDHLKKVSLAEKCGFKALWVRDIPFNIPSFGDAGQTFDPFTYLGFLAGQTNEIALGISSLALPLHHPASVAKAAATVDQLSEGRFIMGIASGDRPDEYPNMGVDFMKRGELFREAFTYLRNAAEAFPTLADNHFGRMNGQADILPKPVGHKIPMLVTGYSRQSLEWNAEHADGWMSYPKNMGQQLYTISQYRELVAETQEFDKPFMQPLYVVLQEDDDAKPLPIPLGFRIGANYLIEFFQHLEEIGVNHVGINLRFNTLDMEATLEKLGEKVLPHFHLSEKEQTNV
ncbi:MAG: LLM class oxidoreductase [Bacteroidota bacterium]